MSDHRFNDDYHNAMQPTSAAAEKILLGFDIVQTSSSRSCSDSNNAGRRAERSEEGLEHGGAKLAKPPNSWTVAYQIEVPGSHGREKLLESLDNRRLLLHALSSSGLKVADNAAGEWDKKHKTAGADHAKYLADMRIVLAKLETNLNDEKGFASGLKEFGNMATRLSSTECFRAGRELTRRRVAKGIQRELISGGAWQHFQENLLDSLKKSAR